ncbi:MAG: alpha,alpha-trehalase TreF [Lewinella sp.]|uniref:alpha,alpha-trehalase TreF n=1 Tax=Lewinella sp. TaxID=2004506 RepID=UPI003D6B2C0C
MLSPEEQWGELFEAVQLAQVFPDGKTFVDCEPKYPAEQILLNYVGAKNQQEFHLRAFVLEHFSLPPAYGSDFVADSSRSMSEHIRSLWPVLTRQPDEKGEGSLLSLPYPYIVPGGRFREIYYWDSYFTMLGLAADGELEMMESMVNNFAYLIDQVGFIPNGNRTYFMTRSQPPFFSSMVGLLAEQMGQDTYVKYLPQLLREYRFWMQGEEKVSADLSTFEHVVRMPDGQLLNRYYDRSATPRPESYREDVETAEEQGGDAAQLFLDLRAACESGWDFSGRWFADTKSLSTIHTTEIIPVDLNALLYHLEQCIARGYQEKLDEGQAALFQEKANKRKAAVQQYCWDEANGFYRDYDFKAGRFTPVLSMAGVYPLFFQMASDQQAIRVADKLAADFLRPGGYTSTLINTGQQWDAPNGWAPLQWMAYRGLLNYGHQELAQKGRDQWLVNNRRVYENTTKMVEKYDVENIEAEAGGGEYPLQDGFGWSNGVAQALLKTV